MFVYRECSLCFQHIIIPRPGFSFKSGNKEGGLHETSTRGCCLNPWLGASRARVLCARIKIKMSKGKVWLWLSYHQSVAFYYFAVDKIFCERAHTTTTDLGVMAYQPVRLGCKQFAIILKNAFCICLLLSKYFWAPEVPRKMFVSFWCNACSAHFFESWDQDLLQWLVCQRFASDLLATCDTPHTQSKGNNYALLC